MPPTAKWVLGAKRSSGLRGARCLRFARFAGASLWRFGCFARHAIFAGRKAKNGAEIGAESGASGDANNGGPE
ncbi:hypothetical protein BTO02_14830 [Paraburkholderia sp. SOS3]|nr:hypothetical protein BTO02_14830 [Paraburkholderia sp. SOS3]